MGRQSELLDRSASFQATNKISPSVGPESVARAVTSAGEIFQKHNLSPSQRWEQIAGIIPEIGPLAVKLTQTIVPFIRFKKIKTPEEEAMLNAFSDIHTRFGTVDTEKSKSAVEAIPSVMTGRLAINQNKLLGSASITEVYDASSSQMPRRKLAAKLQKPGVREQYKQTFDFLRTVITKSGDNPLAKAFLGLTEDAYSEEFDTAQEMENLQKLRGIGIKAPQAYPELSSETTIVMDQVEGAIPLTEYLKTADIKSRKKIAGRYIASLIRMVRHGVIHGDPHEGNVLVDKKEKLTWIDPSPLIKCSLKEVYQIGMFVLHMRSGNGSKMIDTLNKLTDNKFDHDAVSQLKQETSNLKGFDLLKALFAKGLLPPKRHMVLARALAEGVGTVMDILPDVKGFSSWMGVITRGAVKSFIRERHKS